MRTNPSRRCTKSLSRCGEIKLFWTGVMRTKPSSQGKSEQNFPSRYAEDTDFQGEEAGRQGSSRASPTSLGAKALRLRSTVLISASFSLGTCSTTLKVVVTCTPHHRCQGTAPAHAQEPCLRGTSDQTKTMEAHTHTQTHHHTEQLIDCRPSHHVTSMSAAGIAPCSKYVGSPACRKGSCRSAC